MTRREQGAVPEQRQPLLDAMGRVVSTLEGLAATPHTFTDLEGYRSGQVPQERYARRAQANRELRENFKLIHALREGIFGLLHEAEGTVILHDGVVYFQQEHLTEGADEQQTLSHRPSVGSYFASLDQHIRDTPTLRIEAYTADFYTAPPYREGGSGCTVLTIGEGHLYANVNGELFDRPLDHLDLAHASPKIQRGISQVMVPIMRVLSSQEGDTTAAVIE